MALIKGAKHLKSPILLYIAMYFLIGVIGCSTVNVQQPPEQKKIGQVLVQAPESEMAPVPESVPIPPAPEPIPTPKPAPTISLINQSPAQNGTHTITLKGSGFDNGAVVEIYNSSGKTIKTGIIKSKTSNQIVATMRGVGDGKYTVKVKNSDGQHSNAATLTIQNPPKQQPVKQPPPQVAQCSGNLSKKPIVLYLGGGDAEKLFERYLAQNSGIEKLPYSLKVKFYEKDKEKTDFILQTIELGDLEQVFGVESRKDFLDKIKKRLKGRVAEPTATLADDASKENADYFQCP